MIWDWLGFTRPLTIGHVMAYWVFRGVFMVLYDLWEAYWEEKDRRKRYGQELRDQPKP